MVVDGHGGWCGAAEGEESFVVTLRTRFFPAHTPPWKANYTEALPLNFCLSLWLTSVSLRNLAPNGDVGSSWKKESRKEKNMFPVVCFH